MSNGERVRSLYTGLSVFVGFTKNLMAREQDMIKLVEGVCDNYRWELGQRGPRSPQTKRRNDQWLRDIYQPSAYLTLAGFDIALFSLVDGFEFAIEKFHSDNPLMYRRGLNQEERFLHRVIVGSGIGWKPEAADRDNELINLAKDTFQRDPPMPLVGICQIEVNNSFLLIGGGASYLRALAKGIESYYRQKFNPTGTNWKTRIILLESFSWHEFTLLIFSDSYYDILDFVLEIRDWTLLDVGYYLNRQMPMPAGKDPQSWQQKRRSYGQEWLELMCCDNLYWLEHQKDPDPYLRAARGVPGLAWGAASLSAYREKAKDLGWYDIAPFGSHVIFNTTTTLGFSASLLNKVLSTKKSQRPLSPADAVSGVVRADPGQPRLVLMRDWTCKSGHMSQAVQELRKPGNAKRHFLFLAGPSDFSEIPAKKGRLERLNSAKVVVKMLTDSVNLASCRARHTRAVPHCGENSEDAAGIHSVESQVGYLCPQTVTAAPPLPKGHVSANNVRKAFMVPGAPVSTLARGKTQLTVLETERALKLLQIPDVLANRVLNMIALYNQGIDDNFLFSSFLELGYYVRMILKEIGLYANEPEGRPQLHSISDNLQRMLDNFEYGWRNRFHGSWRLGHVSDFNLEFKGGVQQWVSAFQVIWQNMSWLFSRDMGKLAVVMGDPSINVNENAVRLSLHDMIAPELLASRIGHEASEPVLHRLQDYRKDDSEIQMLGLDEARVLCLASATSSGGKENGPRWREMGKELNKLQQELVGTLESAATRFPATARFVSFLASEARKREPSLFFDQVFADVCNFHTVFLGQIDLFTYWTLADTAVHKEDWDIDGGKDVLASVAADYGKVLNKESLTETLMRLFLTIGRGPGALEIVERIWLNEIRVSVDSRTWNPIQTAFSLCQRLTDECPPLRQWLEACEYFARTCFAVNVKDCRGMAEEARKRLTRGEAWRSDERPDFPRAFPRCADPNLSAKWKTARTAAAAETVALLHAYLNLPVSEVQLGDQLPKWNGRQLILRRNRKADGQFEEVVEPTDHPAPRLYDVKEGAYTWDFEFRRKHFMWRSAFVRSFADMAERLKIIDTSYHWWQNQRK